MTKFLTFLFVIVWFAFSALFFFLLFDLLDFQLSLWGKYAIIVMTGITLFLWTILKIIARYWFEKQAVIAESFVHSMYFVVSVFFWSLMTLETALNFKKKD
jgi:hypothetical protein